MCFDSLIKWAIELNVPERHAEWLDDEWQDKEDALRVAVAEAMEKVGK